MKSNKNHYCRVVFLFWVFAVAGCTGHLIPAVAPPETLKNKDFVIVTASSQDTLASLAQKYLKDKDKAWQIATFNDIDALIPGRQVVIPLAPIDFGGMRSNGYQTIPILLYTKLAVSPTNAHTVSSQKFEEQMQYIDEHGFTTVSLDLLHRFSSFKAPAPPNAIVISFDTTQRWVYDIAYPMLKRRGMRGALFIRSHEVGINKDKLNWKLLAEMASDGFDIGIHGTEPDVPAEKDLNSHLNALEDDLTAPQKAFKQQLNTNCRYYAYPKGQGHDLMIALLKKHGYRSAFTRIRGSNPFFLDAFRIRRAVIYGHYSMDKFSQNLSTFRKVNLK